jgi:hypothetical protein
MLLTGEPRRIPILFLGLGGELRQDVAQVVVVLAVPDQPHLEAVERHFVHDRRETGERGDAPVRVEARKETKEVLRSASRMRTPSAVASSV